MFSSLFSQLTVVELANVLAGPSVGAFFAEMGATVIKIESPSGDVTRTWKTIQEKSDSDISAYFSSVNWGKKSIVLDFLQKDELQKCLELVALADIVILSFKYGDAERFGLSPKILHSLNPRLIIGEITGYSNDNPKTAYDAVLQAETGFMSINGQPESPPTKMPVALIDILAGHHAKEGILAALWSRSETGNGALISVSLYDAGIVSLANQAANWLVAGNDGKRIGSEHPNIAPYGMIVLSKDDKEIVLAVGTDKQFATLCNILDIKHLAADSRFSVNVRRVQHRNELRTLLCESIIEHNAEDFLNKCSKYSIPAGLVQSISQALSNEDTAHLLLHDSNSRIRGLRTTAFSVNRQSNSTPMSSPPTLGEHNAELQKLIQKRREAT